MLSNNLLEPYFIISSKDCQEFRETFNVNAETEESWKKQMMEIEREVILKHMYSEIRTDDAKTKKLKRMK